MPIDILNFSDALVPFAAKRLSRPDVLWLNKDAPCLRSKGATVRQEDWIKQELAYAVPDGKHFGEELFHQDGDRRMHAERYGGAGLMTNGGGSRSGIIGNFQMKGVGANPLVGQTDDEWHSYGGLNVIDAVMEAINTEVFNHILPFGAVRSCAVVLTGGNTAYMPFGHHCRGPGALLIRELCVRPAHFLRTGWFKPRSALTEQLLDDVERTRRMNTRLCALLGGHPGVIDYVGNFLAISAAQYAYARLFRIYHGAASPSNISFDGRWLDLSNITFLPSGTNFSSSQQVVPFYGEMSYLLSVLDEFIYTYTRFHFTEFDLRPLSDFYAGQLDASSLGHAADLLGLPTRAVEVVQSKPCYKTLVEHIRSLLNANSRIVQAYPLYTYYSDSMAEFLESLYVTVARTEETGLNEEQKAFREVMGLAFDREAPATVFKSCVLYAAIRCLKMVHFCHFFNRSRLTCDLFYRVRGGEIEGLGEYIETHIDISKWIFEKEESGSYGRAITLFKSDEVEISFDSHGGKFYCRDGSCVKYLDTSGALFDWVNSQNAARFFIHGFDFGFGLRKVVRILNAIYND